MCNASKKVTCYKSILSETAVDAIIKINKIDFGKSPWAVEIELKQ